MTPEQLQIIKEVLPYLKGSIDRSFTNAVYIPPAQAMRDAADALEKQDAAIQKFRDFVKEQEQLLLPNENMKHED